MNVLSIALLVASIVAGAFGIVFVVEAVRKRDEKKRSIALSVGSFFTAIVLALGSSYVAYVTKHKGFTFDNFVWKTASAPVDVKVDAPTVTAMLSGVGVA